MGQDQSKTDESDHQFRSNPKFQRTNSKGPANATSSTTRNDPSVTRSMYSGVNVGTSHSIPDRSNQSSSQSKPVISANTPFNPSNSNVQEQTHQPLHNVSNSPNMMSSSPNNKFPENPKLGNIQNLEVQPMSKLESSPRSLEQQIHIDKSPSKTNFPNNKFRTPERDIRHVPTSNEQIRLDSTLTGNPFLSTSEIKSEDLNENKSATEMNRVQTRISNEVEKYRVKEKLEDLYRLGIISRDDLDELALETLHKLSEDVALDILNQFVLSNPKTKSNKSAYLCSMIKHRIGVNEMFSPVCETNASLSPKSKVVPSSSQSNSAMYFDRTNISDIDFTQTICDTSKKQSIKETTNGHSPVSLSPKGIINDNMPSIKGHGSTENVSFQKMPANASYTSVKETFIRENIAKSAQAEKLPSYNENVTNDTELSPSKNTVEHNVRRRSKLAPRFQEQKQFKRNLAMDPGFKSHSAKTKAFKDVERLAESLSSFNISSDIKTLTKETFSTNSSVVELNNKPSNSSLEECILKMTNVEHEPKETMTLLQQTLYSNLEVINNFISVLKAFPFLSEDIFAQVNLLKQCILSFPDSTDHSNSTSTFINPCVSLSTSEVPKGNISPDVKQPLASISPFSNISFAPSVIVEKTGHEELSSSSIKNILLESFEKVQNERLKSENHQINVTTPFSSLPKQMEDTNVLVMDESAFKESIPGIMTNNKNEQTLGQNHQGILEIVYTSCEKSFELNQTFYICVPCDFWTAEKHVALNHVKNERTHVNQQIENAEWHTCNSCGVLLYATEKNVRDHYLSGLHSNILRIKKKIPSDNSLSYPDEKDEERDDVSVCSSKGEASYLTHKTPHEVLLLIAKNKRNRDKVNGSVGLYCRVCNRYFRCDRQNPDSNKKHVNDHLVKTRGPRNYQVFHCSTCKVELFGDNSLWQEHENMELHEEMKHEASNSNIFEAPEKSNTGAELLNVSPELSNEEGAHFDFMKTILKKHLKNEPNPDIFGFYCHLCETYTLEVNQWQAHVISPSHSNRINSSECINKKMWHNCSICNIILICSEFIFALHQRSLGHEVVSKLHQSRNDSMGAVFNQTKPKNDEEPSDDESEDSEDENEDDEDNDSLSTTSSKNDNNEPTPAGINITGLPQGLQQKELFETFKKFGFITKCTLRRSGKTGQITFRQMEAVKSVMARKDNLYIRGIKINVYPIRKRQRCRKKVIESVNGLVVEVLSSKDKLDKLSTGLKTDIAQVRQLRSVRSGQIIQDILKAVPGCKVHIFGSQFTGIATKDSDCDIYIDYDGRSYFTELTTRQQEMIIHDLLMKLTLPNSGFRVSETVLEARVPILRVVHKTTGIPCDISCRSGLSMENSILTRQLLSSDFRVSWMVIFIKWWMRTNDLLASNKFTSYTTTWLVLFFLMRIQPLIINSVVAMQEGCPPYSIGFWDCRFNRDFQPSKHFQNPNCDSRHKLLIEFFKFYANFNFRNVVLCPLTASLIPRKQIDELKLPPAYKPYIFKIRSVSDAEKLRTTTPICIQDPFDLAHNIAKGVSNSDLNKFKRFCQQSASICERQWGRLL